jgi:hypothetical protein
VKKVGKHGATSDTRAPGTLFRERLSHISKLDKTQIHSPTMLKRELGIAFLQRLDLSAFRAEIAPPLFLKAKLVDFKAVSCV